MKITIISVGKIKEAFYRNAIAEYSKRLSAYCKLEIREVADEKTPDGASEELEKQIRNKEGERILKALDDRGYCIALAIDGKKYDSIAFAKQLEKLAVSGKSHIQFVIGGSLGLSEQVLSRADEQLSFSDMTFPHQLMRVILLEQIYRSFRINNHEPYHK
jgi:23S rRNA (pseudouridine1915-N3)-methyltransferase